MRDTLPQNIKQQANKLLTLTIHKAPLANLGQWLKDLGIDSSGGGDPTDVKN